MKTKIFYIILTAVLSFSTISVFADGTKGKKESDEKKNTIVSHLISSIKEAEMELESWMTTLSEFNSKSENFIDKPLEMEDWMLKNFNTNDNTENFQDEELVLEDWMLESFDVKTQEIFVEEELRFEPWMFEIL